MQWEEVVVVWSPSPPLCSSFLPASSTDLPACVRLDVCVHVFGRLSPSLEYMECCSFTAQQWDMFPASGCWCEGKCSLASCRACL